MLLWFSLIKIVYAFQFLVHILVALVLQVLYQNSENGSDREETLRGWLVYISPFHPDLKEATDYYHDYAMALIVLSLLIYIQERYLESNRLHFLYQIRNPIEGRLARHARIDHYIENLLWSNANCREELAKMDGKNREALEDLHRERIYLNRFRRNRDSLMPGYIDRNKLKNSFLYIMIILTTYTYTVIIGVVMLALRTSKELHLTDSHKFKFNLISLKLFFDLFFVIMLFLQWSISQISAHVISLLYYRDMLKYVKLNIEKLMVTSLKDLNLGPKTNDTSRKFLQISPTVSKDKYCHYVTLISYIQLRYILDTSLLGMVSIFANIYFTVPLPFQIYKLLYRKKDISLNQMFIRGPWAFWDLGLVGFAHEYLCFASELKRILSIISILSYTHIECNNDFALSNKHSRNLWMRLAGNETQVRKVFLIHILNTFELNYKLWFRIQYYTNVVGFLYSLK